MSKLSPAIENLIAHIDRCPLGWDDKNFPGQLISTRSTKYADVLAWVKRLVELREAVTAEKAVMLIWRSPTFFEE